jgi:hypothetical protein
MTDRAEEQTGDRTGAGDGERDVVEPGKAAGDEQRDPLDGAPAQGAESDPYEIESDLGPDGPVQTGDDD